MFLSNRALCQAETMGAISTTFAFSLFFHPAPFFFCCFGGVRTPLSVCRRWPIKYRQAHIPGGLFCNVNSIFLLFTLRLPRWKIKMIAAMITFQNSKILPHTNCCTGFCCLMGLQIRDQTDFLKLISLSPWYLKPHTPINQPLTQGCFLLWTPTKVLLVTSKCGLIKPWFSPALNEPNSRFK